MIASVKAFSSGIALLFSSLMVVYVVSLINEDQRVYAQCMIKNKSADYCLLKINGR